MLSNEMGVGYPISRKSVIKVCSTLLALQEGEWVSGFQKKVLCNTWIPLNIWSMKSMCTYPQASYASYVCGIICTFQNQTWTAGTQRQTAGKDEHVFPLQETAERPWRSRCPHFGRGDDHVAHGRLLLSYTPDHRYRQHPVAVQQVRGKVLLILLLLPKLWASLVLFLELSFSKSGGVHDKLHSYSLCGIETR